MAPRTQQRITLPPAVVACIRAITSDGKLPSGQRLAGVLMLVYGWAWCDAQESIDPTCVALPEAQWQQVGNMLATGVDLDPIAGVNLLLDWMNRGPSGYRS